MCLGLYAIWIGITDGLMMRSIRIGPTYPRFRDGSAVAAGVFLTLCGVSGAYFALRTLIDKDDNP